MKNTEVVKDVKENKSTKQLKETKKESKKSISMDKIMQILNMAKNESHNNAQKFIGKSELAASLSELILSGKLNEETEKKDTKKKVK